MKLINFYESKQLNSLREKMGAELNKNWVSRSWKNIDDSKLAELLRTGEVEVEVDEISTKDGVFEYEGQKVVVYIRDQSAAFYEKLKLSGRGYKFHLTKCDTITKQIQNKRISRYVVSLRTDGQFKINLIGDDIIVEEGLIEPLKVCKNCLKKISYKKYTSHPKRIQTGIYEEFNLDEYFAQYKVPKLNKGNFRNANNAPLNVYSKDFKITSKEARNKKNYKCDQCEIDMSKKEHHKFCHAHHIDGDKSNNSHLNLQVLCIECHASQPMHSHVKNNPDYHEFISRTDGSKFLR